MQIIEQLDPIGSSLPNSQICSKRIIIATKDNDRHENKNKHTYNCKIYIIEQLLRLYDGVKTV